MFLSLYSFHCYLPRGVLFDDMTFKLQEHELTMSTSVQQYTDVSFISCLDGVLSHPLPLSGKDKQRRMRECASVCVCVCMSVCAYETEAET